MDWEKEFSVASCDPYNDPNVKGSGPFYGVDRGLKEDENVYVPVSASSRMFRSAQPCTVTFRFCPHCQQSFYPLDHTVKHRALYRADVRACTDVPCVQR